MRKSIPFIILALISFIVGCANISTPQGGPEDETPPVLLSSVPEQGQTNYQGQSIFLTFDEWVNTKNIETDIIITPRVTGSFKTRVKKNTVELSFFEPFRENTTYSVGFGSTIQDITNNNPAQNLNLSFSTGAYIDSLTISGNVKTLLDQEPAEDALVALYFANDSTDILNGVASYFSITDTLGNYKFVNLPAGDYRLYATNDKNNNNKADSKDEKYGFYPDTLQLNSNLEGINLTIQNLNTTELRKLSSRHFGAYYDITFNKQLTEFQLVNNENLSFQPVGDDKIRFYRNGRNYGDTLNLIYQATDSLEYVLQDTVKLYFTDSKVEKADFTISTVPNRSQALPGDTLVFEFSKPLTDYNLDSINITIDSTQTIDLNSDAFKFNQYRTELNTGIALTELITRQNPQLNIYTGRGAFISADGDSSKVIEKAYNFTESSETASITGKVTTDAPNIIVQLLSASNKEVVRESYSKDFSFQYLPAGRYMVRVIDDRNGNRKLDIGNMLTHQLPEDIHYYFDSYYQTKVIEVRKNWENTDTNISF